MGVRGTSLALLAGLIALGLFAASPFLCSRLVGTGESFNYSLSEADALVQMRAGNIPPLAGQTLYAFNGRIHPLRNAPYLHYLAAAIDAASFHRLSFWQIQNASLAVSLVGAFLACYVGLRRGVGCPPLAAFVLSALYGLSPPLLGAAYYEDLYMTVHASVFVPLAVAACLRGCLKPSFSADAWLAAALAGAWLAHPPVALWLTAGVAVVRVVSFAREPSGRALARGICALVLLGGLASFAFVSVVTLNGDLGLSSSLNLYGGLADGIVQGIRDSFPASLLPVGTFASARGHLQFGYPAWILLIASVYFLLRRRNGGDPAEKRASGAAASALAYSAALLLLLLPVPFLNAFLWHHVPNVVIALTNLWPMQRLYLVALPFTLFAAALVLPKALRFARVPAGVVAAAMACGVLWSAFEARMYLARGFSDRLTPEATQAAYRPSNLDLTVTSYAYFGAPPSFVNGVMDPQFEFRLLRGGTKEIDSPLSAAEARAPVVATGLITAEVAAPLTLEPGRRYLLSLHFRVPPAPGFLALDGPLLHRTYSLPAAGPRIGFGMLEGQRRAISVWSDSDRPERVSLQLSFPKAGFGPGTVLADYMLREVRSADLPVRLDSLFPMRFTVESEELGSTVETPRSFLSGYSAKVNGVRVPALISPDRRVMVPVPKGRSEVELTYPGPRALRISFWVTVGCWLGFILVRLTDPWPRVFLGKSASRLAALVRRHRSVLLAAAVSALVAAAGAKWELRQKAYLAGLGPIEVRFRLPYDKTGFDLPLLKTGHPGAGVVVFVRPLDERHVEIGADVWGQLHTSDPIELDFSVVHSLVVSDSALYPLAHPRIQAMNPAEIATLRRELRVELDGKTAIRSDTTGFETTLAEIEVGASSIGSLTDRRFAGEISGTRRLPIPRSLVLSQGRHTHLEINFPRGRSGLSEPLLCSTAGDRVRACYATYLGEGRLRITSWSPEGTPEVSAEIAYDPEASHTLDFFSGDRDDRSLGLETRCLFDGKELFGEKRIHAPDTPILDVPGVNEAHVPGVLDRFTGPQMDVSVLTDRPPRIPAGSPGPLHLIVSFPEGKRGRSEPLLATGRTGKGDLIYVTYVDEGHVRIGYDHWGVGGVLSPAIPLSYKMPHEIWISLSSLGPAGKAEQSAPVSVVIDGKQVVASPIAPYPSTQKEITPLQNRIGASTADPDFSGLVHFMERISAEPEKNGNSI